MCYSLAMFSSMTILLTIWSAFMLWVGPPANLRPFERSLEPVYAAWGTTSEGTQVAVLTSQHLRCPPRFHLVHRPHHASFCAGGFVGPPQ